MDIERTRYIDHQNGMLGTGAIRDQPAPQIDGGLGLDAVMHAVLEPDADRVQSIQWNPDHVAGLVVHTQDQAPTDGISEYRDFLAKAIPVRAFDFVVFEHDALEFQLRVFAQPNLLEQIPQFT